MVHALQKGHLDYFRHWVAQSGSRFDAGSARAPLNHQYVPLFAAVCGRGHLEAVRLLLKDPTVNPAAGGSCCLRYACSNGRPRVVALLLGDGRAAPAAFENEAMYLAAHHGHEDVVRLMARDPRSDSREALRWCKQVYQGYSGRALQRQTRADPARDVLLRIRLCVLQ